MRVLVTGGEGFLGKRLCTDLTSRGHEVATYDYVKGQNILDYDQFHAALKECNAEVCVHLAAVADLNIMRARPEESWKINVDGTRNVMKACDDLKVRCLFASTCCAYGNNNCHPSNEDSPLCPTEVYAESKKVGEGIVTEYGAPHTSLRLATFYGPTMRSALVHAVFLTRVHRNEPLHIHGSGKQTRTYTHVDDIVSGIVTVLESDQYYPVVTISHNQSFSVFDVAKFAMDAVGREVEMIHVDDRPGQIYTEEIDNARLRSMGWTPKWNLKEGMHNSYEGMKAELEKEDLAIDHSSKSATGETTPPTAVKQV